MERKQVLGISALFLIAVLGVGAVSAFGLGEGKFLNSDLTDAEKTALQAERDAMKEAIENEDYASWEALMQERLARFEDRINEEQFAKVVEKHEKMSDFRDEVEELKESGELTKEAVQELREEYGIEGPGKGFKKGPRLGKQFGNCPHQTE